MTNVLIRRLIGCGYTPDSAYDICRVYIQNLSDLEIKISQLEEQVYVDKIQSKSHRKKCKRLCSTSGR